MQREQNESSSASEQRLTREQIAHEEVEAATKRLQALLSVTDTALTYLALDDLLREMLKRVREIMQVDTAAILLMTEDKQALAVRAANGLEEAVTQQARIPIGHGFAGTIAASAEPLVIERVETAEIVTPLLREQIQSLLGVPLLVGGSVIGVIHVGTRSVRRFTGDEIQLLQRVADRIALSIVQSRLYEGEQRARARVMARASQLETIIETMEELVRIPGDADVDGAGSKTSPDEAITIVRRLADLTCTVLECLRVGIVVVEPETEIIRAMTIVGSVTEREERWLAERQRQEISLKNRNTPFLAALRENKTQLLDMSQPTFDVYRREFGASVVLCVPMILRGQLMGILALDFGGQEHQYTSEETALAKTVARLSAVVIERERLQRDHEEARASELALRESHRRMDEFLSMAGHELRTPLTTIKGNVQLSKRELQRIADQPSAAGNPGSRIDMILELLERADTHASFLNGLIGELMDASRISAGILKTYMQPVPCDLLDIALRSVQRLQHILPRRVVRLDVPVGEKIQVMGDAERLEQAITHYLSNALKFSAADSPVDISVRVDGKVARLAVRDEGPGIPPDEQQRIWKQFYRTPGIKVRSGSSVGLGLGLFICRTIIEHHHGAVGVISAPAEGSTFWFTLPLADEV